MPGRRFRNERAPAVVTAVPARWTISSMGRAASAGIAASPMRVSSSTSPLNAFSRPVVRLDDPLLQVLGESSHRPPACRGDDFSRGQGRRAIIRLGGTSLDGAKGLVDQRGAAFFKKLSHPVFGGVVLENRTPPGAHAISSSSAKFKISGTGYKLGTCKSNIAVSYPAVYPVSPCAAGQAASPDTKIAHAWPPRGVSVSLHPPPPLRQPPIFFSSWPFWRLTW